MKDQPRASAPGVTRRGLPGSALAAGAAAPASERSVDVLLIGVGIISATLGILLRQLEPSWTIDLVERLDQIAKESSNGWNNAGPGHSALRELNYTQWMPLMMEVDPRPKLAATRSPLGTDCDWGEVTRQYIKALRGQRGVTLRTGHEVRALDRTGDGSWRVTAHDLKTDAKHRCALRVRGPNDPDRLAREGSATADTLQLAIPSPAVHIAQTRARPCPASRCTAAPTSRCAHPGNGESTAPTTAR